MAISKEKKHAIVSSFSDIVTGSESLVFVQFDKLTVANSNALRRKLRAANVGYKVGKKTLLKRVLSEQGYTGELPALEGEIAVAYSADPLASAREVYEFQAANKGLISIVGGIFEKGYKSQGEMLAIATIPPLQTLRGMFVNIINSPIQRFAIALDQIAKKSA
ncbi:MAG TPA: 50S ribosomal protein L10 [Candidatus Paceibacterota bacterium]|jgi:large subunit ribosomal protein L10|nr:50S ribosomal protein L10 [Candidatus Paceibacterota bacterium]